MYYVDTEKFSTCSVDFRPQVDPAGTTDAMIKNKSLI